LEHPRAEQLLKEALKKESWNDVIRQAALEGFSMNKSADWIPLLLTYTKQGHSQKLRLAALRCLSQFGSESDRLQPILLKLLNDPFPLMQIASVRLLHHMGDERAIPALKKITVGHFDGRLKRLAEEAMERITKGFE
jgi:aminopeptidase N